MSGATVNATLVTGLIGPYAIAVSGPHLFVTDGNAGSGTIGEYTTSGETVNATLISGLANATGLAVVGSNIFVTNGNSDPGRIVSSISEYSTSGAIVDVTLINSASNYYYGIAISGGDLFVTNNSGEIGEFTTSGAAVSPTLASFGGGPHSIAVEEIPELSNWYMLSSGLALLVVWHRLKRRA